MVRGANHYIGDKRRGDACSVAFLLVTTRISCGRATCNHHASVSDVDGPVHEQDRSNIVLCAFEVTIWKSRSPLGNLL